MLHHARLLRLSVPLAYEHQTDQEEVRYFDGERLSIDEARELQRVAHLRPLTAPRQVLVIRTNQIMVEAQNALLKLFEEPPSTTRFVLVTSTSTLLLPTLLSRLVEEGYQDTNEERAWATFISASVAERLDQIDRWQKSKDSTWLQQIQNGLLSWVSTMPQPSPTLQLVAERLGTRGASNKMLLEALALDSQLQNS